MLCPISLEFQYRPVSSEYKSLSEYNSSWLLIGKWCPNYQWHWLPKLMVMTFFEHCYWLQHWFFIPFHWEQIFTIWYQTSSIWFNCNYLGLLFSIAICLNCWEGIHLIPAPVSSNHSPTIIWFDLISIDGLASCLHTRSLIEYLFAGHSKKGCLMRLKIEESPNMLSGGLSWIVDFLVLVVCDRLSLGALEKSDISFFGLDWVGDCSYLLAFISLIVAFAFSVFSVYYRDKKLS